MITGIDHPAIAAKDVAALVKWYVDVLEFKVYASVEGGAVILGLGDGTFIEVMPCDGKPRPERDTFSAGLSHLALRVKDLDNAIWHLEGCGVTWTNEISPAVGGGRLRNFFDPEGNLLQIVERS